MSKRLLLVAPAGRDRDALKRALGLAGYEVVESSNMADASGGDAAGGFQPDVVLLDSDTDTDTRLALRNRLGRDNASDAPPVVEMCLSRPELFAAAAQVLDRVSPSARPPGSI